MSNLKVFAENSSNILGDNEYNSDTERTNGFQSGTTIHSKIMNTALRQSTLISTALANTLNLNVGSDTSLSTVQTDLNGKLPNVSVSEATRNGQILSFSKSGTSTTYTISPTFNRSSFLVLPTDDIGNYFVNNSSYQFVASLRPELLGGSPSTPGNYVISFPIGVCYFNAFSTQVLSSTSTRMNGNNYIIEIRISWGGAVAGSIGLYINAQLVSSGATVYYREVY